MSVSEEGASVPEEEELITYSNKLTATYGDYPLVRAMNGLLKALVLSGCSLESYKYSGDDYSGYIQFTAQGTARQVDLMRATISGWARN